MPVLVVIPLVLTGVALAAFVMLWSYGRFARQGRGEPAAALEPSAPGQPDATRLDRQIAPFLQQHAGESGLALLDDDLAAFSLRLSSARQAGRSLDLQYYMWQRDLTGRILAGELLAAADRGVRIRLLLDDLNARGFDRTLLGLDAHPNIAVRLFNPSRNREGGLGRAIELLLRGFRLTRRMHNKAWIADGRLAIVGGRNIGDAYFAAGAPSSFRDLDVALLGAVVGQCEAVFDSFWNSAAVIPMAALRRPWRRDLARLRRRAARWQADPRARRYLARLADGTEGALLSITNRMHWTREAEMLSDPPQKVEGGGTDCWLMPRLRPALLAARRELHIISPYFVPGEDGVRDLLRLAAQEVSVAVLTNSLAATDVLVVHGGYAPCRLPLLAGGVALFELKPYTQPGRIFPTRILRGRPSLFGSRSASLHGKAFTVDGSKGFVGSMNFDPRSRSLNTEMGVVFNDARIAAALDAVFAAETAPQAAWRLLLDADGALRWEDGGDGDPKRLLDGEPQAGFWRRLAARAIGLLPIRSQL